MLLEAGFGSDILIKINVICVSLVLELESLMEYVMFVRKQKQKEWNPIRLLESWT